jgi:hypothetical protein
VIVDLQRASELRYLGQEDNVADAARFALRAAPDDGDVLSFHGPVNFVDVVNDFELKSKNPALYDALRPLFEAARQARKDFEDAAKDAAAKQSVWDWNSKESLGAGEDPLVRYPKQHAELLDALNREADARAKLRAAEMTLPAAAEALPDDLQVTLSSLEIPTMANPEEIQPAYESTAVTSEIDVSEASVPDLNSDIAPEGLASQETGAPEVQAPAPVAALQSRHSPAPKTAAKKTAETKTPSKRRNTRNTVKRTNTKPNKPKNTAHPLAQTGKTHPGGTNQNKSGNNTPKPPAKSQTTPVSTALDTSWYSMLEFWTAIGSVILLGLTAFMFFRVKRGKALFGIFLALVVAGTHYADNISRHHNILTYSA